MRSQWARYNLPRYIGKHIIPYIFIQGAGMREVRNQGHKDLTGLRPKKARGLSRRWKKGGWCNSTWWLIPLSKCVITPVISGLTLLIPFITGVITHLLSGMSHQANPWRIHGAAIYGVPWIPSIYPLYVSIPAPWIRHGKWKMGVWEWELMGFYHRM